MLGSTTDEGDDCYGHVGQVVISGRICKAKLPMVVKFLVARKMPVKTAVTHLMLREQGATTDNAGESLSAPKFMLIRNLRCPLVLISIPNSIWISNATISIETAL